MKHYMRLNPEPFEKMRSGQKSIELRLYDDKRRLVRVGDLIEFADYMDKKRRFEVRVTDIVTAPSFEELYSMIPLDKCGYDEKSVKDASPSDMDGYYSREEQAACGVVAIYVELTEGGGETLTELSKYLCLILRHRPQIVGITLDEHGWADVDALIEGVNRKQPFDREMLEYIVARDDKGRYSFSDDGTKIRANHGHSVKVDVELAEKEPPEFLWHGTGEKSVSGIMRSGIVAKSRMYVHLSGDERTAMSVGLRHGKPVLFRVSAGQMYRDGIKFYQSADGVWLTSYVPVRYLELTDYNG